MIFFWRNRCCCWCGCCAVLSQSRRPSFCPINENEGKDGAEDCGKTAVVFSIKNEVGCLVKALRLFQVSPDTFTFASVALPQEDGHVSPLPAGEAGQLEAHRVPGVEARHQRGGDLRRLQLQPEGVQRAAAAPQRSRQHHLLQHAGARVVGRGWCVHGGGADAVSREGDDVVAPLAPLTRCD